MNDHTPMCDDLHRRSPRREPCICHEDHRPKLRKTPVDTPYIVTVRKKSRYAQIYGAKAWYDYPRLARERRADRTIAAIERLMDAKRAVRRLPRADAARMLEGARADLKKLLVQR